ncbi:MAG TPA: hypothetical protein VFT45_17720 [Longimicrobium sp.]|nr:hypothetical protein [Longimicrobium sp.]
MRYRATALSLDSESQVVAAAWGYELALSQEPRDVGLRLDLAALYAVVNDTGFSAAHHLDARFVDAAYPRARELLEQGLALYPGHPEFHALMYHLDERVLGRPIQPERLETLASDPRAEFARLLLYVESGREAHRSSAEATFRDAAPGRTARQRYYMSFAPASLRGGRQAG